jgi:hypothetical protein
VDWKTCPYVLLGDDIVICNDAVASIYKEVLSILGVEYSIPKTYISSSFFEFAKRLFHNDIEISPFPISALSEASRKYYILVSLFEELRGRG